MFCESCGAKIENNDMFCSACGFQRNTGRVQSDIQNTIKESTQNAFSSFKHIAINPVGNLQSAYDTLNKKQSTGVGVVFSVVFSLLFSFGLYLLFKKMLGGFMGFIPDGVFIKLFIAGFVPFAGIVSTSALLRQIFDSDRGFEADMFVAGVTLLPAGISILLSGMLGVSSYKIIAVLGVLAASYMVLILFTGFTRILKISDSAAAVVVPACLLISAWFTKAIVAAMVKPF